MYNMIINKQFILEIYSYFDRFLKPKNLQKINK